MLRFLMVFLVALGSAHAADTKGTLPRLAAPQEAIQCITLSSLDGVTADRSDCCSYHVDAYQTACSLRSGRSVFANTEQQA